VVLTSLLKRQNAELVEQSLSDVRRLS